MRIIYGAFAQGQGHFSKASVLIPLLEKRGHEVRLISSGWENPPPGYSFNWHRHFPCMSYEVTNGQTDFKKTLKKWVREMPLVCRHFWRLRQLVREYQPDLVISDFEPLTASPVLAPGCEVIAISRQVTLSDRQVRLPDAMMFERKMTRTVIRLFTIGADRLFGYHYEPASFRCLPPIIRDELKRIEPTWGDHIVVYNHYHTLDGGSPEELINWANRNQQPVKVYGLPMVERGKQGFVEFLPPHPQTMLDDMASSRGVITTAGLTTPVEAFLLRKPVCVVPIPGQWEQIVNAFHQDHAGIAQWCERWDYDRLLDTAAPVEDHPLSHWLTTPPDRIVDRLLDVPFGSADQPTDLSAVQSNAA